MMPTATGITPVPFCRAGGQEWALKAEFADVLRNVSVVGLQILCFFNIMVSSW